MKTLIVDDDRLCRELIQNVLSPYGRCDLAFDGREAAQAFRIALEDNEPYDLVCLDIMMPEADGHQTLEAIRELEHEHGIQGVAGVKVIMTTALTNPKHCIRAFKEGCEAYLPKPINHEHLLAQIEKLLGAIPQGNAPEYHSEKEPEDAPRGNRYLIVDDDRICREFLKAILSQFGECDMAYDGREALDAVLLAIQEGRPYDAICLDIMMPGTSGHDALQAIRKIEAEHGIHGSDGVKVIMTTALDDSKHCIQAFREGCESYVIKPIREGAMLQTMHQLELLGSDDSAAARR